MIDKLHNKYIFFDIDGTLAEYRYADKLYGGRCVELGCQSLENLLFGNLFIKARPLKTIQKIISKLDNSRVFIIGTIVTNNEMKQKYEWLKTNYPNIKKDNIIFVSSTMLKPDIILEYAKHYNIKVKDTILVDDRLDVLRKAEELGITAYHPSSFTE